MRGERAIALVGAVLLAAGCGGASGGGLIPDPGTVTIFDVQAQVFSPTCATTMCHVGSGAPHGLDLSAGASAGNLIGVISQERSQFLRVEPGNAADSYLYMKITGDARIGGDPMPAIGGPLGAGDVALIETWIDQGAH